MTIQEPGAVRNEVKGAGNVNLSLLLISVMPGNLHQALPGLKANAVPSFSNF
jgi:hypothetical protein